MRYNRRGRTGGEIGRRSGFRFHRREACGFKSRPVHPETRPISRRATRSGIAACSLVGNCPSNFSTDSVGPNADAVDSRKRWSLRAKVGMVLTRIETIATVSAPRVPCVASMRSPSSSHHPQSIRSKTLDSDSLGCEPRIRGPWRAHANESSEGSPHARAAREVGRERETRARRSGASAWRSRRRSGSAERVAIGPEKVAARREASRDVSVASKTVRKSVAEPCTTAAFGTVSFGHRPRPSTHRARAYR